MRRTMRLAVTLCAALLLCTLWAGAEELTEQQRSSLDTSALEQTAPEELSGVDALSLSDLTDGLNRVKETVLEEVSSISKRIWRKPAMPTGTLQVLRSSAFVACSSSASAEV